MSVYFKKKVKFSKLFVQPNLNQVSSDPLSLFGRSLFPTLQLHLLLGPLVFLGRWSSWFWLSVPFTTFPFHMHEATLGEKRFFFFHYVFLVAKWIFSGTLDSITCRRVKWVYSHHCGPSENSQLILKSENQVRTNQPSEAAAGSTVHALLSSPPEITYRPLGVFCLLPETTLCCLPLAAF